MTFVPPGRNNLIGEYCLFIEITDVPPPPAEKFKQSLEHQIDDGAICGLVVAGFEELINGKR